MRRNRLYPLLGLVGNELTKAPLIHSHCSVRLTPSRFTAYKQRKRNRSSHTGARARAKSPPSLSLCLRLLNFPCPVRMRVRVRSGGGGLSCVFPTTSGRETVLVFILRQKQL